MARTGMRKRPSPDANAVSDVQAPPSDAVRVSVAWPVGTRDAVLVLQLIQGLYNAIWRNAQQPVRSRRPRSGEVLRWTVAADGHWTFSGDPGTCATLVQVWRQCRALGATPEGADAVFSRPTAWDRIGAEVRRVLPDPGQGGRDVDRSRVVRALWRLLQLERQGLLHLEVDGAS